jgi:ABC-2 type transport system permease protein
MLFVFLAATTSSVALIETRRLGVSRRMPATPTGTSRILYGKALAG